MDFKQLLKTFFFWPICLISMCLIIGVQFVPQSSPYRITRGSGFHIVEVRIVWYGWPIAIYSCEQERYKVGPNSGEGADWIYDKSQCGYMPFRK